MQASKTKGSGLGFSLSRTFASLRYPNYRLRFIGQMISLFGTWMQTTALGFYVFDLRARIVFIGGLNSCFFMFTLLAHMLLSHYHVHHVDSRFIFPA